MIYCPARLWFHASCNGCLAPRFPPCQCPCLGCRDIGSSAQRQENGRKTTHYVSRLDMYPKWMAEFAGILSLGGGIRVITRLRILGHTAQQWRRGS